MAVRARGRVRVPPLCRSGGLVSCSGLVRFSEGVGGFVCSASSCWAPSSPVWLGFSVFGGTAMDVLAAVWWSLFPCCLCATVLVSELWWAVYDLFLRWWLQLFPIRSLPHLVYVCNSVFFVVFFRSGSSELLTGSSTLA